MKELRAITVILVLSVVTATAQVQPSFLFNQNTPYGTLDIRTKISSEAYYYLQEGKTFSYRESEPGVKSGTFKPIVTHFDTKYYDEGHMRYRNGSSDLFAMNYRLLKPGNYQEDYKPGYPIIVVLHGGTERANCLFEHCYHGTWKYDPNVNAPPAPTSGTHRLLNNDHHLKFGGGEHLQARNLAGDRLPGDPTMPPGAYAGFVLMPQMFNDWDPESVEHVVRIVQLLLQRYNIDPNKVYVTGLSAGGYAVYEAIRRAPWMFAAAIPICAIKEGFAIDPRNFASLAHIPLWVFQGGIDTAPTPANTKALIGRFRDAGGVVRYTEYPGLGHTIWNSVFSEPDFFSWFLKYDKTRVHVYQGKDVIRRDQKFFPTLMLAEGFFAYEWEKDGVLIPCNTPNCVATDPGVYRARFSRVENPEPQDWNAWSKPVVIRESEVSGLNKTLANEEISPEKRKISKEVESVKASLDQTKAEGKNSSIAGAGL